MPQVAIVDAALSASDQQRIELIQIASASAKRFGNMLQDRQVQRMIEIAETADGDEATAAAAFIGSLNLGGNRIVPLILSEN